jgi:hypothetical protein
MERKEREANKDKIPKDAPAFKSTVHGNRALVKDLITYGLDDKAKKLMSERSVRAKTAGNCFHHEAPFKPGIKYPGSTLNKFPEHMSSRKVETVRSKTMTKEKEEGKETWRPNNWGLSRPTPSIVLHPKNIHCGKYR